MYEFSKREESRWSLQPPGSYEWIESQIYVESHLNPPSILLRRSFVSNSDSYMKYAILMSLWFSHLTSTLNYSYGWEPIQPRHDDTIIRSTLYPWPNNPWTPPTESKNMFSILYKSPRRKIKEQNQVLFFTYPSAITRTHFNPPQIL